MAIPIYGVAELIAGAQADPGLSALAAEGHERMVRRLSTLEAARQIAKPLVIDEAVGDELARLRVALKAVGKAMKVMDA